MVTPHSMKNITPEKTELELPEHTRIARPDGGRTRESRPEGGGTDGFSPKKGEPLFFGAAPTLVNLANEVVSTVPPVL